MYSYKWSWLTVNVVELSITMQRGEVLTCQYQVNFLKAVFGSLTVPRRVAQRNNFNQTYE